MGSEIGEVEEERLLMVELDKAQSSLGLDVEPVAPDFDFARFIEAVSLEVVGRRVTVDLPEEGFLESTGVWVVKSC